MDTRDILIALDIYCEHDWEKMLKMINDKEVDFLDNKSTMLRLEAEKYALLANGYKFSVLLDDDYPEEIKNKPNPPFVIYYKGDLNTVSDRYTFSSYKNTTRMFVD